MNELTSVQLSEWEAYDRLDPVGEWRADFRMAYLCSIVTNIARRIHGKKGVKMTVPLDFMPDWCKEDSDDKVESTRQTTEEMKQIMLTLVKQSKKNKKGVKPKRKS